MKLLRLCSLCLLGKTGSNPSLSRECVYPMLVGLSHVCVPPIADGLSCAVPGNCSQRG